MKTMKTMLALLLALCLFGAAFALGEGLTAEDGAFVEAPVAEEAEAELWTEAMEAAGETAVAAGEELWPLVVEDMWGPNRDPDMIVLNVPDPVMEGAKSFRSGAELSIHMDLSETLTGISNSNESAVAAQVVEGSEGTEGGYYNYVSVKVDAVKKGSAVITATTSLGRSVSVDINVVPFEYLPIDAAMFPDAAFRSFLLSYFSGVIEGGYLLPNITALSTTKIDYNRNNNTYFKDAGILNFQGIEYFPALEVLYLGGGKFESLDLSKNTKLQIVDLSYCENLKRLDISGCVNLEALQCNSCALTSLDVSHCPDLYVLVCDQNKLTSLDVRSCPRLRVLKAEYNSLTGTLDVSKCPELLELYCGGGSKENIETLNITGCPTLIRCYENDGLLNEGYSYITVRGNGFSNTRKVLSFSWYKTSIRIGDVVHAHLTPTAAPTAKPTAAPTAKPTAAPTVKAQVVSSNNYVLNAKGTEATFTGPAKSAKTVTIPDTITVKGKKVKVTAIADKAFYKDKKLTTVTIGKNVKTVGKNAFYGCKKLKTVKGGAAIATIKDGAFRGCVKLASITLNKKVKTIGKNAFYGCKKLKKVTIKTAKLTSKTVGKNAFKGIYSKATFKCPKKQLKSYKKLLKKKGAPKKAKYK